MNEIAEDEHSGHDQDLVTYDNETGAIYVYIPGMRDREVHQTTAQIEDFINLDWTRDGHLIGVEILTARTKEVDRANAKDSKPSADVARMQVAVSSVIQPPKWKFETCRRCGIQAAYCLCSQPDVPGLEGWKEG